eukprot:m.174403 g.174403  ORF g.174403 m.174403 type:complete len:624 (+) comp15407_c0_seq3:333-2204(+)
MADLEAAISMLRSEPADKLADSVRILTKIISNLSSGWDNPKYRTLRTTNEKINKNIVQIPGALSILKGIGFVEHGEELHLEQDADKDIVLALVAEALELLEALGSYALSRSWGLDSECRTCAFMDDENVLVGCQDNSVQILPRRREERSSKVCKQSGHETIRGVSGVTCVGMCKDSVISCGKDGAIIVWDVPTCTPRLRLCGHGQNSTLTNAQVISSAEVISGSRLLTGSWDTTAILWDLQKGTQVAHLKKHEMAVLAVAALSESIFITGGGDGHVIWWKQSYDPLETSCIRDTAEHTAPIRALAVVNGAQCVVSVDNKGMLFVWTFDGVVKHRINAHSSYIFACVEIPETNCCVTGGDDGTVKIWEFGGETPPTCKQTIIIPGEVLSLGSHNNGDILVSSSDRILRAFSRNVTRHAPAAEIKAFNEICVAFSQANQDVFVPQGQQATVQYDYEIPLQMSGGRTETLRFTKSDDIHEVAKRFIQEHKLPQEQVDELVLYIRKEMQSTVKRSGRSDYTFPVELDAGRSLQIEWNHGDDPNVVADQFLLQHGLDSSNKPDILAFIATAQSQQAPVRNTPAPGLSAAQQDVLLGQVVSMGFAMDRARDALQKANWNLERALESLLN